MLKRAKTVGVFENKHAVRVVRPEDIIGLKVQAAANNPSRQTKEYADIETIMEYYRQKLDWRLIEDYCELFKEDERFRRFKERYGTIE